MKRHFSILLFAFCAFYMQAQVVINGDFNLQTVSWGCSPEAYHYETTYGGTDPTNIVAEIDMQAGLCQTINGFVAGHDYTFSFDVSRRTTCGPTIQSFNFEIDSGLVLSTPVSRNGVPWGWTEECFTFTATDTTHEILFYGTSPGTCALIVDNLKVNAKPTNNLKADTSLCYGEVLNLFVSDTSGTYLWQDSSRSYSYVVDTSGTYWLKTSVNTCDFFDTIQVTYSPEVVLSLGADTNLCFGSSLVLSVFNQGATYKWNTGSAASQILVDSSGIYWVDVTVLGCTARDSILVTFAPELTVDLGPDITLCPSTNAVLSTGLTQANFLWSTGSTDSTITIQSPGTYWVQITAGNCISSDTIVVHFKPDQFFSLGKDTIICQGKSFALDVYRDSIIHYIWQDGSTASSFTVSQNGRYWVTLETVCEKIYSDTVHVVLDNCDCKLFLPNSFTPNNDGINDYFKPETNCTPVNYEFSVFNRWGELIFFTKNPEESWDGTKYGKPCPSGVYSFRVQLDYDIYRQQIESGIINLIK